ncbi:MAG: aminoacyl-tRNA hydrolase [Actinomycetaceae bacterium]|nr:aminoacyl-tRNA hydrolase [Actinomycetaceae bacterium]MDU0970691.1 aminoacyl-tRNA hydrolase [Actinomycetaceae bacterium]
MAENTWLVVGLGNPGEKYAHTRHNVGHETIDVLTQRMGATLKRHRTQAFVAEGRLGIGPGGAPGPRVVVATLACYMNTSGGPVSGLVKYFHIDPTTNLLVIHDDMDIEAHDLRLKRGGGEGGHNGLKSISTSLGTRDYARLRVGIGRPPGRMDPADYVLAPWPRRERDDWAVTFERAADAVEDIVTTDFLSAQQRLHTR